MRHYLVKLIYKITRILFPDAKLEIFGSIPLQLDSETSDIDVSIQCNVPDKLLLTTIKSGILMYFEYSNVFLIHNRCKSKQLSIKEALNAKIPVITLEGLETLFSLTL